MLSPMVKGWTLAPYGVRRRLSAGSSARCRLALIARPAEVIIQTDDVILAKVGAVLNLDKDQWLRLAQVFDPMGAAYWNINRRSAAHQSLNIVKHKLAFTRDKKPVLRAAKMTLVTEPPLRVDSDALDLVVILIAEHQI